MGDVSSFIAVTVDTSKQKKQKCIDSKINIDRHVYLNGFLFIDTHMLKTDCLITDWNYSCKWVGGGVWWI